MDKEHIIICADHGGFGGSYNLNRAINLCSTKYSSSLVTAQNSPYSFGEGLDPIRNFKKVNELFTKNDKLFICDYQGLIPICKYLSKKYNKKITHNIKDKKGVSFLINWLKSKKTIFFWSGSRYRNNYNIINKWVHYIGSKRTFAMCDLLWCDLNAIPLMQTYDIDINKFDINKFDKFTVCHSPGVKYNEGDDIMGSPMINSVLDNMIKKIDIKKIVLKGVPYEKALLVKSKCHIFIDQIMPGVGGIGKSGLEAMIFGVPVICDVNKSKFYGYYSGCPVIHAGDKEGLRKVILELYNNSYKLYDISDKSLEWSKRLSFQNTVKYLEDNMEW